MRGLRVDTFKIFDSAPVQLPGGVPAFNHIPGKAARPRMDDGDEPQKLQWVSSAAPHDGPCRAGLAVAILAARPASH